MPKYVEGCNKLFKPGSNISNFQVPQDDIKPLKKPNKYLGKIPNKEKGNDKKEKTESTEKNVKKPKNTTQTLQLEETHKEKILVGKLEENETDVKNNNINDSKLDESKNDNISTLSHKSMLKIILDEEDYATSE